MIELARTSVIIAMALAVYSTFASVIGGRKRLGQFLTSSRRAVYGIFGLLTIAFIVLGVSLVNKDYSLKYVAEHVSNDLPGFYAFSAIWAGQEGSLLLWAWLLSMFGTIALVQNRRKNLELMPYVNFTISAVLVFFLILLTFITNPFARLGFTISQGQGLNPLLQNPGMVFHPPALYLGYVGFTIPFAFAVAALMTKRLGSDWIKSTRRWTLMAWLFLSIGILLGAKWAYEMLGWGGYWGWDPVENASLLPWLTGTAFLHSVMIQEKRRMLKIWNVSLIMTTFLLTIFGTFITRSGIIQSVHSFSNTGLGPIFLFFMGMLILFSITLIYLRREDLRGHYRLDSLLSRESTFLFNNLILVGSAFAVLWGTLFPIISEAVQGTKITVGPPFFNTVNVPIAIALIALTGICPMISWRKATRSNLLRNFLIPGAALFQALVGFYALGVRSIYPLMALSLIVFVVVTILLEFYRGTLARMRQHGENPYQALVGLTSKYRRRYGGYVVHIGMMLIFVGITGSTAFQSMKEATLDKGKVMTLGSYKLKYLGSDEYKTAESQVEAASFAVWRNGQSLGIARPSRAYYTLQRQSMTHVSILSNIEGDFYLILGSVNNNGSAQIKAEVNPLIGWLWWGGYILIAGTLFAMWPQRKREKAAPVPAGSHHHEAVHVEEAVEV